jgi:hypothetical protein
MVVRLVEQVAGVEQGAWVAGAAVVALPRRVGPLVGRLAAWAQALSRYRAC